jgi:hypothetical protein
MEPLLSPHASLHRICTLQIIAGAIAVSCTQFRSLAGDDGGAGGGNISTGSGGAVGDASAPDAPVDAEPSDVRQDALPAADLGSDAGCVARGAEDCFNGLDDDCNGHKDCDDPACSAVSTCVPIAPGLEMGTVVASGTTCPFRYSNAAISLGRDLDSSGVCTGCSCALQSMTCSLDLFDTGSACNPGSLAGTYRATLDVVSSSIAAPCGSAVIAADEGWRTGASTPTGACAGQGTPTLSRPADFLTKTTFCGTPLVGGGCAAGYVCVPVKPSRNCVRTGGAASCPSGYSAEGVAGGWYTGIADQRTCGASCACGPSQGGQCGAMTALILSGSTCGAVGSYVVSHEANLCPSTSPKNAVTVGSLVFDALGSVRPTCGQPTNQLTGSVAPTGPQTLCCSN